jgi:hypothetical protein
LYELKDFASRDIINLGSFHIGVFRKSLFIVPHLRMGDLVAGILPTWIKAVKKLFLLPPFTPWD